MEQNCATYKIATDVGKSNILKQTLNNIGILNNKHSYQRTI